MPKPASCAETPVLDIGLDTQARSRTRGAVSKHRHGCLLGRSARRAGCAPTRRSCAGASAHKWRVEAVADPETGVLRRNPCPRHRSRHAGAVSKHKRGLEAQAWSLEARVLPSETGAARRAGSAPTRRSGAGASAQERRVDPERRLRRAESSSAEGADAPHRRHPPRLRAPHRHLRSCGTIRGCRHRR